ncbi:MAG TPA: polysaccharide lyase family protein [Terriglobales bacterium]|nr:polysaccharide lyase family protein [Terriglobales bacterium]
MGRSRILIYVYSTFFLLVGSIMAHGQGTQIFAIGTKDGSFKEFIHNREPEKGTLYRVGESSPDQDWYAYQPGPLDSSVGRSTMQRDWMSVKAPASDPSLAPFHVAFALPSAPKGTFILHLDAIFRYRRPAPPRYAVSINGKPAASYQLSPHPSPDIWWSNGGESDGNMQYFGYESLDMQLPASAFNAGSNTLSLQCLEGFGIFYDDLTLSNNPNAVPPLITQASVEPTVLYKARPSGLVELAKVHLRTSKPLGQVNLQVSIGGTSIQSEVNQSEAGDIETTIEVPASEKALPVTLQVSGISDPVYKGAFTPLRRWQVYALAMEQADFGYNDLPARTLEWENRFTDKALEIQKQYPSYSFNLDAAANLDSYLATRDEQHGKQLLDHLRSGKWGINALYTNFFTGLSTPEEIFRTLDYSLRAGREHTFPVDSASQTDEPSLTWAFPQVLADAGIKYFTNGSDPIRGAFNPIGHLNFHSPFYWEAATGAKVLVWSGVSYTAIDDMTWGGWNADSLKTGKYTPSTFGLNHSLPLFLSQFERQDFPFDAVMLFGLHNDEIPLRHAGDADVIDAWNQEYAYPKIIPATQRDFFTYITTHFGDKIKTYRGDGGAYWEDEAGSDARITAMIRTSQSQLAAAEKFESIANWLQPHLKYDRPPFDAAWKNILLADSYVWSDANSFRRPESYRTRGGEATHRSWAEAALQETSDLRLVALDKVAELVATDQQGTVVFNPESWPRSDFFDFELDPNETLLDPATGEAIPCGVLKSQNGYQDVRCWASEVPATGYKFYALAKGNATQGEAINLDPAAPTVENKFYKLVFDPQTGAIAHLFDKSNNEDLVNSGGEYRMNEYLYVTGGDPGGFIKGSIKDNRILTADVTLPLPELAIHHASSIDPPQAKRFPWGTVVTVHLKATNTPEIISTITLLDTKKQINIQNEVQKTATLKKEGIYFAFPFALKQPEMKYQGATAWVNPVVDMLPGANRQWFTTQGGVFGKGVDNNVAWTSVDAPLITLEDINRGLWPESIQVRNGTLFSYVMNNYWYTDTPAQQGGNFTFRYALTSGQEVSSTQAEILTSEQRSPLTAIRHYNMGWTSTLSDKGAGFLNASPAGVTILTIRPLDHDDAYLIRVQNTTPDRVTANLQFPTVQLEEAYLGSVLGGHIAAVSSTADSVTVAMGAYEIKTVIVRIKNK